MLSVNNLSFGFDAHETLLSSVSFTLNAGEVLLLVGASGSGKSSMASVLTGFYPENGGHVAADFSIMVNDTDITSMLPQSRVHYICQSFQNADSYFCMDTLRKELIFTLENMAHDSADIDNTITRIAQHNYVTDILDKPLNVLSMGEKQRAAFTVLDVIDSQIYILDEPFANLDTPRIAALQQKITEKTSQGKSFIIIDHHYESWCEIADQVALLTASGTLINNPDHEQLSSAGITGSYPKQTVPSDDNKQSAITLEKVTLYAQPHVVKKRWYEPAVKNPQKLLDNATISFPSHRLTALVGNSGCGKSTLLMTLLGQHDYAGTITIANKNLNDYTRTSLFKTIGMIFQNPSIQFTSVRVANEVGDTEEGMQRLQRAGLVQHKELSPFLLSEGQKRRLAVICMLIGDKTILLVDEPTYGQDFHNSREIMNQLKTLTTQGVTIIFTTHDQRILNSYADDIVYLHNQTLTRTKPQEHYS